MKILKQLFKLLWYCIGVGMWLGLGLSFFFEKLATLTINLFVIFFVMLVFYYMGKWIEEFALRQRSAWHERRSAELIKHFEDVRKANPNWPEEKVKVEAMWRMALIDKNRGPWSAMIFPDPYTSFNLLRTQEGTGTQK